jgi:hypothetical protein
MPEISLSFFQEMIVRWGVGKYALTASILWYAYYRIELARSDMILGRNPWLAPFQLFWKELLWYLPGGMERRIAFLKEDVIGSASGMICGSWRLWSRKEVRDQNLYRGCAQDVLPGIEHLLSVILVPVAAAFGVAVLCNHW